MADALFVEDRYPLPEHLRVLVCDLHERGREVLSTEDRPHEDVRVALAVEAHRWFWRPRTVRVVLIAESHVWTAMDHVQRQVNHPLVAHLAGMPSDYVRLIYCLASGERELLDDPGGVPPKPTAFWNIFGRAAGNGRVPTASGGADLAARIRWKLATLDELARRGVWLLDASVHAIYSPTGRVSNAGRARLHRQWAKSLGAAYIAGCPNAKRVAVGKGVYQTLRRELSLDGFIYQPQAERGRVDMNTGWAELLAAIDSAN